MDVSKLGAGTATGHVTISSATNQSLVVPVTIAVANAASAVLSVSPATESLSLAQGSAKGASGRKGDRDQFRRWRRCCSPLKRRATRGWLATLGARSPVRLRRRRPHHWRSRSNPSGLNPGLYSGRITVHDSNSRESSGGWRDSDSNEHRTINQSFADRPDADSCRRGRTAASPVIYYCENSGAGTLNWAVQTNTLAGGGMDEPFRRALKLLAAEQTGAAAIICLANSAGMSARAILQVSQCRGRGCDEQPASSIGGVERGCESGESRRNGFNWRSDTCGTCWKQYAFTADNKRFQSFLVSDNCRR